MMDDGISRLLTRDSEATPVTDDVVRAGAQGRRRRRRRATAALLAAGVLAAGALTGGLVLLRHGHHTVVAGAPVHARGARATLTVLLTAAEHGNLVPYASNLTPYGRTNEANDGWLDHAPHLSSFSYGAGDPAEPVTGGAHPGYVAKQTLPVALHGTGAAVQFDGTYTYFVMVKNEYGDWFVDERADSP